MNKFILVAFVFTFFSCTTNPSVHYDKAKEAKDKKEYENAIYEYWNHINKRLAIKNRPDWENPYIYLLDIGDIYVEQGDIANATKYYEMAEEKGVKQGFVNDRYRFIASWYEEKGELDKAIEQLKKYQDRDPELFNLMLDRIAKDIVKLN